MARTHREPDPECGVFRWALTQAGGNRIATGIVGALMFSVAVVVAGYLIPTTWGTHVQIALMALGMAGASVTVLAVLYALVVAPYEQRNALRTLAKEASDNRATLTRAVIEERLSDDHGAELKAIAQRFRKMVSNTYACGVEHRFDVDAFASHFPDEIKAVLDWNRALTARADVEKALAERMTRETVERGIVMPHYTGTVIGEQILFATERRAEAGQRHLPFRFKWGELRSPTDALKALWWTDIPSYSIVILENEKGELVLTKQEAIDTVESLFWDAQDWPETLTFALRDHVPGGWRDQKQPLIDKLDALIQRDFYKYGNGCPRCKH
jgi:hypothetical protein